MEPEQFKVIRPVPSRFPGRFSWSERRALENLGKEAGVLRAIFKGDIYESSVTIINEEGEESRESLTVRRPS